MARGAAPATTLVACLCAALMAYAGADARAQGPAPIELTIERMVELGLKDSYRVQRLLLDIDRGRALLRAEQAGLKSRVYMNLAAPDVESISDYKWNSTLQRNELIHENTRRWQMDLSVRQPVILFGYPTNGYLSLNNRIYRYAQAGGDVSEDAWFYNRYFVEYTQPLFQPNFMRHSLEDAELDLEQSELGFQGEIVSMVSDLTNDYLNLFEAAYGRSLAAAKVQDLEAAAEAARAVASTNATRSIELDQVRVALANAREEQQNQASNFRLRVASLKQRLRLSPADSVTLTPELDVRRVNIEVDRAVQLATSLAPRMRLLAMDQRRNEISLNQTKGNNAFRVNLGLTYGREVQDPRFQNLWVEPRNSYTVSVDAYVPLWDWGQRRERIRAQEFSLERTHLSIEQARTEIEASVRNEVNNLTEYEQRALNMQANLQFAEQITATTLGRYRSGEVALVDLLQTIEREADTADNLLDAFLGFRRAALSLQRMTFYDFERDQPVLERYRIGALAASRR
jgi:outer membrane protein TolC